MVQQIVKSSTHIENICAVVLCILITNKIKNIIDSIREVIDNINFVMRSDFLCMNSSIASMIFRGLHHRIFMLSSTSG